MTNINLTPKQKKQLELNYQECEFKSEGNECAECKNEHKDDRLWFDRLWFESYSYEYPNDGDYYCDWCALNKLQIFKTASEEMKERKQK